MARSTTATISAFQRGSIPAKADTTNKEHVEGKRMQIVQTRGFRSIAVAIVFFFTWSCCRLWTFSTVVPNATAQHAAPSAQTNTTLGHYTEVLQALQQTITDLEQRLAGEQDITPTLAQLQEHRQRIKTVDTDIRTQFQATEDTLKAAKLPPEILMRHQQMVEHYGDEFQKLWNTLQQVEQYQSTLQAAQVGKDVAHTEAKYNELKLLVATLKASVQAALPEPPHTPLDPNKLPHRPPTVQERKPRLNKGAFQAFQKPIQLALLGEPSALMLAQAAPELPVPEDLTETPDVPFSQPIRDLAAHLEHNPVKIYEYVRNNFTFEPTYGSIKGSQETFLEKSGNAMDLASLLIALLRVSGIPARYVIGTVEIPIAQVMNWVGIEDARTAGNLLASGGIPSTTLTTQEGEISHIRLEHTWVSAYVDYVPSRGAIHQTGDTWVEVDPTFKQFKRTIGIDLNQVVPFDVQQFFNEVSTTGTVNELEGFVTGFDQALIAQRIEDRHQAIVEFFQTTMPETTLGDVLGTQSIVTQELGILPASLPYRVLVRGSVVSTIPDPLRHKVRFQLPGLDTLEIFPTLAGKRITLSYVAATEQDQSIIEAHTQASSLPAYLIRVKPILKLNGTIVATGAAVQLGQDQQFRMEFIQPLGERDITEYRVRTGAYYAIGFNLQTVSSEYLKGMQAEAEIVKNKIATSPNALFSSDELFGLWLQVVIMSYWAEGDIFESMLARIMRVRHVRPTPAVGLSSLDIKTSTLFGIPVSIQTNGSMSLDVRRDVIASYSVIGDATARLNFLRAAGLMRSQLEASVFEQLFVSANSRAVSTTVILQAANQAQIPIFRIDQANVNQILPQLQVSPAVMQDIRNSINAGRIVTIPKQEMTLGTWHGTGYIIEDPETGSGAYIISGGIAGGAISIASFMLAIDILLNTLVEIANKELLSFLSTLVTYIKNLITIIDLAMMGTTGTFQDLILAVMILSLLGPLITSAALASAGVSILGVILVALLWQLVFDALTLLFLSL